MGSDSETRAAREGTTSVDARDITVVALPASAFRWLKDAPTAVEEDTAIEALEWHSDACEIMLVLDTIETGCVVGRRVNAVDCLALPCRILDGRGGGEVTSRAPTA